MILDMKIIINLLLVALLVSCGSKELSKEQMLSDSIEQIESRMESRKLSDVAEFIDENYSDEQGRTLRDVKRVIQMQFMRHKTLFILSNVNQVEWTTENEAQVTITAALTGQDVNDVSLLKSIRADMVSFDVKFIRQDDKFVVSSARWQRAYPLDFL